jgi:hypothetical protein
LPVAIEVASDFTGLAMFLYLSGTGHGSLVVFGTKAINTVTNNTKDKMGIYFFINSGFLLLMVKVTF